MRYLSLFQPAQAMSGPPSQEDMAVMGKLVHDMMASGELITTGGIGKRETGGFTVTRKGEAYKVQAPPETAWMRAGGFAILEARDREHAIAQARRFLDVAGDGTCEVVEISQM
ncbi:MAG: hypothetical protein ABUL73_02020 [Alphaproteobacteria bacterium]